MITDSVGTVSFESESCSNILVISMEKYDGDRMVSNYIEKVSIERSYSSVLVSNQQSFLVKSTIVDFMATVSF